MKQVWKEFKEFAIKGNALDLAVGVIIGAAFSQIVNSLVNDILNPFLSILTGKVDFSKLAVTLLGTSIRYGAFINALINFILVALVVFLAIKQINRFRKKPEPNTKDCEFCKSSIPLKALRCPNCTSQLS